MIAQRIGLVSLVVDDYDDALAFFIGKLGFSVVEDTVVPEQAKRWLVVAPAGGNGSRLLLAKASNEEQKSRIGSQAGGRVFLFLYTDNFWRDYERYKAHGIVFVRPSANRMAWSPCSKTCTETCGICWNQVMQTGASNEHVNCRTAPSAIASVHH